MQSSSSVYIESQSHAVYDIARSFPRGEGCCCQMPAGQRADCQDFAREKVSHGGKPYPRVMHRVESQNPREGLRGNPAGPRVRSPDHDNPR